MTVQADTAITDHSLRIYAGYGMKRAFNAIRADVTATLQPLGLRMVTFSALSVIGENPGLRQSQLADILAIERPNLVSLVDELEGAGLIARREVPEDRRARALTPTEQGWRVLRRARRAVKAHDARMTAALSEAERARLIEVLTLIERAGEGRG